MCGPTRATRCIWRFRDARNMRWPGGSLMSGRCPHTMRVISRRLSRVTPGGNAGLRGIVFEPIAWKTMRLRAVQASLMDQLQPSTHVDKLSDLLMFQNPIFGFDLQNPTLRQSYHTPRGTTKHGNGAHEAAIYKAARCSATGPVPRVLHSAVTDGAWQRPASRAVAHAHD